MIHWHPDPANAIREGTSYKAHCGRLVKVISDDADEVIEAGCKRCQATSGFPDLPPKTPWKKKMVDAAKEVRALAKAAKGGTISTASIEAVFKSHGL